VPRAAQSCLGVLGILRGRDNLRSFSLALVTVPGDTALGFADANIEGSAPSRGFIPELSCDTSLGSGRAPHAKVSASMQVNRRQHALVCCRYLVARAYLASFSATTR
jgi:hypothetical protein